MKREKATLEIHQKLTSPRGLIREIEVWKVSKTSRYPEGVKYRLVLVDPATNVVLLLFDNHWPKGHHVHVRDGEEVYEFQSIADLVRTFIKRSEMEEIKYHEDKKNKN